MQKIRPFRDRSPFSLRIGAVQVQTLSRICTKTLRKRAEQTTEQKAEQNRRTDTNNAERLDEMEIASSGLDPRFLVERPTNTTHFRSVDFTPRSRSLCSGSHNTYPVGILNSQKGFETLRRLLLSALVPLPAGLLDRSLLQRSGRPDLLVTQEFNHLLASLRCGNRDGDHSRETC